MQDRQGFNLFKFVKGLFDRKNPNGTQQQKVDKSNKKNPRKGEKAYSGRFHTRSFPGAPKLYRKMDRARDTPDHRRIRANSIRAKGAINAMRIYEEREANSPGSATRNLRLTREWMADPHRFDVVHSPLRGREGKEAIAKLLAKQKRETKLRKKA